MERCLIGLIKHGALAEHFPITIDKYSHESVYEELRKRYPDGDIKLEGHNFKYTSNAMHWMAASYGDHPFIDNYEKIRAPAHFNPDFFQILNSQTI